MEGRQRRSFTDDYKRQAVDLVGSSGRSFGSVAKELGLRKIRFRRSGCPYGRERANPSEPPPELMDTCSRLKGTGSASLLGKKPTSQRKLNPIDTRPCRPTGITAKPTGQTTGLNHTPKRSHLPAEKRRSTARSTIFAAAA